MNTCTLALSLALALLLSITSATSAEAPPIVVKSESGTDVLKWKDGKRAPFLLAFDDSCPTHIKNVIPALIERKIPATFYVIAGNGAFKDQKKWAEFAKSPYIILGNHTLNHKGAQTIEEFETEVVEATKAINERVPQLKPDRLISYGKPGGVKFAITDADMKPILAKHNLVDRPPFWGAAIHVKTEADMQKLIDTALSKGEMGHLDFHGVGGDWLAATMEFFNATLDALDKHRDQLWLTDAVSYHKYAVERKTAAVKVIESSDKQIRLSLSSDADPAKYDQLLSLATKVPAAWTGCTVKQGANTAAATVKDGIAIYDALPGADEITLTPTGK